jgi:hypothetical protein
MASAFEHADLEMARALPVKSHPMDRARWRGLHLLLWC